MKIGIDISQIVYKGTGVAHYVEQLVKNLIEVDKKNEYVFFFSSLRKNLESISPELANLIRGKQNVHVKHLRIPPGVLDIIWNRFHIIPIENFIGDVDVFISSDWTQPPAKKTKMVTILYDLIVYKYPGETAKKIIEVQKRKLGWVKKEAVTVLCISEATKKDAIEVLGIGEHKLQVIYPGI